MPNVSEWFKQFFGPKEPVPLEPREAGTVLVQEARKGSTFAQKMGGAVMVVVCGLLVIGQLQKSTGGAKLSSTGASHTDDPNAASNFRKANNLLVADKAPDMSRSVDELARAEQALAFREQQRRAAEATAMAAGQQPLSQGGTMTDQQVDPIKAEEAKQRLEQKQREWKSYFASPVIAVPGDATAQAPASTSTNWVGRDEATASDPRMANSVRPAPAPEQPPADAEETPTQKPERENADCVDEAGPDNEPLYAVCEGTMIEARLETRVVGDAAGPMTAKVARDVRSRDRLHVVIPAGTKLLGEASGVGASFQTRLMFKWHRILLPDGRGVNLKQALGLDQFGAVGVRDRVNRHIPALVLSTVALGGLSALSYAGTGSALSGSGVDMVRQGMGQQAAMAGQQMFNRQYGRNTLTIMEGHLVYLHLGNDLHIPEWRQEPK